MITTTLSSLKMLLLFLSVFSMGHAVRVPLSLESNVTAIADIDRLGGKYALKTTLFPFKGQQWKAKCFKETYGFLTYSSDHKWASVYMTVGKADSVFCRDDYEFKLGGDTVGTLGIFSSITEHKEYFITTPEIRKQISDHGIQVYMWEDSVSSKNGTAEEGPQYEGANHPDDEREPMAMVI